MSLFRRVVAASICCAQIAGCASGPDSIDARYVNPNIYKEWSCGQLTEERDRLGREVSRVSGLQRENANADAAMMAVGLVLFWPVLFGLAATKDRKDELGRLKGEFEAVEQQSRFKQCVLPPPVAAPSGPTAPQPPINAGAQPPKTAPEPIQPTPVSTPASPAGGTKPGNFTECRQEGNKILCR
ncbi:MAG TPA: hypothetical protein VJ890_05345 [Vineibacter sp.]|nr:hypothetical protein [Vineibacter sp.]